MLEGLLPSMKNEEEEELLREKLREKEKAKFEEDSDNEDEGKKEKVKVIAHSGRKMVEIQKNFGKNPTAPS